MKYLLSFIYIVVAIIIVGTIKVSTYETSSQKVLTLNSEIYEKFRKRYLLPAALYDTQNCLLNACDTLKIISQLFLMMQPAVLKGELIMVPKIVPKEEQKEDMEKVSDWKDYTILNDIEEYGSQLFKLVRQIESRLRSIEQPVWNLRISNQKEWNLCSGGLCHCNPETKHFICWNQNLETVPVTQVIPLNMVAIDLSRNILSTLHKDTFRGLTLLQELDLSKNRLDFLPYDIFTDLDSLIRLRLQYNHLEELDYRMFWKLRHLNILDLSKNRLIKIHVQLLAYCPRLTVINFSDNRLADFPTILIKDLLVLEELDISRNRLSNLSTNSQFNLDKLELLDFSWNIIEYISDDFFSNLKSLKTLNLHNNRLTMIRNHLFNNLISLSTLDLTMNRIDQIEINAFGDLKNLRELFMGQNSLINISQSLFLNNKRLERLTLNSNNLSCLDIKDFEGLHNLKHLMLNNNNLKYLNAQAFGSLQNLEKLRLDSNKLQYLPANAFRNLVKLKAIKLDKNPWHCDCRVLYLARWLREFHHKIWDIQPTCRGPGDLGGQEIAIMRYNDLCDGQWASMLSLSPRLPIRKNLIITPMNYTEYFNIYLKHIYPENLLRNSPLDNKLLSINDNKTIGL